MFNALIIGWDRPVPGHEKKALELFASAGAYLEKKKVEGAIDSYEPVLLSAHAGAFNGMWLVKGKPDKIAVFRGEEAWLKLVVKANVELQGLGIIEAYVGDGFNRVMKIYQESL